MVPWILPHVPFGGHNEHTGLSLPVQHDKRQAQYNLRLSDLRIGLPVNRPAKRYVMTPSPIKKMIQYNSFGVIIAKLPPISCPLPKNFRTKLSFQRQGFFGQFCQPLINSSSHINTVIAVYILHGHGLNSFDIQKSYLVNALNSIAKTCQDTWRST